MSSGSGGHGTTTGVPALARAGRPDRTLWAVRVDIARSTHMAAATFGCPIDTTYPADNVIEVDGRYYYYFFVELRTHTNTHTHKHH